MVFVDSGREDFAKRSWGLDPDRGKKATLHVHSLLQCLKAQPSEIAVGSKLQRICDTPPASPRFNKEINALQLKRASHSGYQGAWISEMDNV